MAQADNLQSRDTYVNALAMSLVNGQSLANVPGLIKQIISGDMWQERVVSQTKQVAKFRTFREFVEAHPPEGLHTTVNLLINICQTYNDMEAVALLANAEVGQRGGSYNPEGLGGRSGKGTGIVNHNNIMIDNRQESNQGTGTTYTMRRLSRQNPELHRRVVAGELSPNAAAIEAGFRERKMQVPPDPAAAGRYLAQRVDADWMLTCYDAFMMALSKIDCE